MRKLLLILVFLSIVDVVLPSQQEENRVVATVGDVKITEKDIERYMMIILPQRYYHRNLSDEKLKSLRETALNTLIERELLYYEARKKGIKVSEEKIDEIMNQMVKRYRSKENLKKLVAQTGLTLTQFRNELKKRLMIQELIKKYVQVNLTDKDLKKYYEENKYKFKEPKALKLRYIFIKIDPSHPKSRQIARERAEKAYEEIKAGKDFGDVAARYSDDLSRIKGGDVGYVHKGRFSKEIESQIYRLKIGEVSPILETEMGFHIIKVEGERPERLVPFKEIKNKLKRELTERMQKENLQKLLEDAKKDLKVVIYQK